MASRQPRLVAATLDGPLELRPSVRPKHGPVGHYYRREVLGEQLLGRAFRERRVRAECLADPHANLPRQAPEGVGGEEEAVRVPQERGVAEGVTRRRDQAEA